MNHKTWNLVAEEVETITDRLGKPIDEGIKETVIALRLHNFNTSGSCEGHLNWGYAYPWVDIGDELTNDMFERLRQDKTTNIETLIRKHSDIKALRQKNLQELNRFLDLLTEYYKNKAITEHERLNVGDTNIYGYFRLQSQGGSIQLARTKSEQKINLEKYQNEIRLFTHFLKQYRL
jgi:hypothetical protein